MKKISRDKYSITARVVIIRSVEVEAASFEAALETAKGLTETDFVTVDGDYDGGSMRIISVGRLDLWSTDDYQ